MDKIIAEISQYDAAEIADWKSISESGIKGIMMSVIADRYGDMIFDERLNSTLSKAADTGLMVGMQAVLRCADSFAAHRAAALTAEYCKKISSVLTLPVVAALSEKGSSRLISQGKDGLTDTVIAFLFETERCGNESAVKAGYNFADTYLDMERLKKRNLWMDDTDGDDSLLIKRWGRPFSMRSISNEDKRYVPALFKYAQSIVK